MRAARQCCGLGRRVYRPAAQTVQTRGASWRGGQRDQPGALGLVYGAVEYARHNGDADLIGEFVDGSAGW
jgi:hypothetical protein